MAWRWLGASGAGDDDLDSLASKLLEMPAIEREDALGTAFARARQDESIVARPSGDGLLTELIE